MNVSYQWLQDFVKISLPADELASRLTMAGLEVKAVAAAGQDRVFEIEITSNRPDWLSMCGVAREVAALTGSRLCLPRLPRLRPAASGKTACRIDVERAADCPLYTGWIIRGVRVGASPAWLQKRLEAVGCRSVNNVVDITNYFLFAYGQPLHAFDLARLSGAGVGVRRGRSGEELTVIDGTVKQLSADILVITDARKPVAIAGVMGGKDSEVTFSTTDIFLESAVFNPVVVRRGRQKLALQTEASYRFERGVDPGQAGEVAQRACAMIIDMCGGTLTACGSQGTAALRRPAVTVDLGRVSSMLNVAVSPGAAAKILQPLGFGVKVKKSGIMSVSAPSFRQDVCSEVDVLEEIARIYGYERIPSSLPRVALQHAGDDTHRRIMSVKNILVGCGLYETVTYSLVDRQLLAAFGLPEASLVGMQDPLNQDQEIMRTSLVPSLCRVVSHNLKQQQPSVRIFEIARVYSHDPASGFPVESYRLAVCLCGDRQLWYGRQYAHVSDEDGLLHLKGIAEELCRCLGASACAFRCADAQTVQVEIDGVAAGSCYQVARKSLEHVDIKNRQVFAMELDLAVLFNASRTRRLFREFSRLPRVTRDISIVIDRSVGASAVVAAVRASAGPLLADCVIADFYTGSPIPSGKKNITLSCVYASSQRTLQEEDVLAAHTAVTAALKEKFAAQLR